MKVVLASYSRNPNSVHGMRGPRRFCQRGSNSDLFLLDERRNDPNTTISGTIIGLPAKRHLNGVSLACRRWLNIECWLRVFMIVHGIRISIAKKPYIFVSFQDGVRTPCPPSGFAHAWFVFSFYIIITLSKLITSSLL